MITDSITCNANGELVVFVGKREVNAKRLTENLWRSFKRSNPIEPGYIQEADRFWGNPGSFANFFDLQGCRLEDLPFFQEAEMSAIQGRQLVESRPDRRRSRTQAGKDQTPSASKFLVELKNSTLALTSEQNVELIAEAAAYADEELFVKIAAVIKARWKRKQPNYLRFQMVCCWTECLLWLMTDQTATIFLRDHVRFEHPGKAKITVAAYSKTKRELKLFQHPAPPITGIAGNGKLFGPNKKEFRFVDVK